MKRGIAVVLGVIILGILAAGLMLLPNLMELGGLGSIPDSDELWYTSGPHDLWENETYSIVLRGVVFTFLYIEQVPQDATIPAHFEISFSDATTERLTIYLPGILLFDDVIVSNHTNPQAALYTHGATDVLWKWFCAVSLS